MVKVVPSQKMTELDDMHAVYRHGGAERDSAPYAVYREGACPYPNCGHRLQAIDFRLEAFGRAIHDPLVRAWWNDTGFAGRCPSCNGWIHFTIRRKRAISNDEAAALPQLPSDWTDEAVIL